MQNETTFDNIMYHPVQFTYFFGESISMIAKSEARNWTMNDITFFSLLQLLLDENSDNRVPTQNQLYNIPFEEQHLLSSRICPNSILNIILYAP